MSLGISLADILKLLQGCAWLKDRFDDNNSADERLRQFVNDINLLEKRLKRLAPALEDALERYEHPEVDAFDLQCDLRSLIGDVEQTIQEAKELARTQIRIQRNAAGFIHNVIWAAHAESKVEVLRKAMQFHAQKIYLVIEPVNLKLLTTIDGKMDEMLEKLDRLLNVVPYTLPPVPDRITNEFRQAIFKSQPIRFEQLHDVPLKDGFDALYAHYRASTYAFRDRETAEQTPEQYLNLLKCQWLLNVLRNGNQFKQAGSLYPRLLKQIEQKISKEHQRSDITSYEESELKQLNPTAYLIWPAEQVGIVKTVTDPNSGEYVILRLTMPTPLFGEKDSVVIFRTGPSTLRIAKRSTDRTGVPYYESEHYNIHRDTLVPFYAIAEDPNRTQSTATLSRTSASISIYRGNATGAIDYRLSSETDVYSLQRAATGYQVVFDKQVTWAIKQSGLRGQLLKGRSRMQIWHWKPLEEATTTNDQTTSPIVSNRSPRSYTSAASDAVVEKLLQRRDTSRITVDERSTSGSIICATTPPHPVIIIYGKKNEVYTYYHVELDFGLQIVTSACACESESKKQAQHQTCRRTVIEKREKNGSRRPITTRTLTADKNDLSTWNLGVFAQPRHPSFRSTKVQPISNDFLNLDFDCVPDRLEFTRKYEKALHLRNIAEKEYRRIIKDVEYLGEKNGRSPPPPPPPRSRTQGRSDSISSIARVGDRPPVIRSPSPVSVFRMSGLGVESFVGSDETDHEDARSDAGDGSGSSSGASIRTVTAFGRWSRYIDR